MTSAPRNLCALKSLLHRHWLRIQFTLRAQTALHYSLLCYYYYYIQVAELASLAQLLPPCSPTVRNPAPDSSLKSIFSPITSASTAAPGPDCGIRCCFPFASASSCCSPIAPASAAARRFHDQLLLPIASAWTATPRLRPIASASTAAPLLHTGFQSMPGPNVLEHSSRSSRFSK